jgi:hypothetical protein
MQLFADRFQGYAAVCHQPGIGTCQTIHKGLQDVTRVRTYIDALISNKKRMRFGLGAESP